MRKERELHARFNSRPSRGSAHRALRETVDGETARVGSGAGAVYPPVQSQWLWRLSQPPADNCLSSREGVDARPMKSSRGDHGGLLAMAKTVVIVGAPTEERGNAAQSSIRASERNGER
jgi:hypothetical protein